MPSSLQDRICSVGKNLGVDLPTHATDLSNLERTASKIGYKQHERLWLREVEVRESCHPEVDVVFGLCRISDDLAPQRITGKGALY